MLQFNITMMVEENCKKCLKLCHTKVSPQPWDQLHFLCANSTPDVSLLVKIAKPIYYMLKNWNNLVYEGLFYLVKLWTFESLVSCFKLLLTIAEVFPSFLTINQSNLSLSLSPSYSRIHWNMFDFSIKICYTIALGIIQLILVI